MQLAMKDLPELAGWQAVKKARSLVAAGAVMKARLTQGDGAAGAASVAGVVVEGRRKYVCTLVVRSLSEADNRCSCRQAQGGGQICEHSVAVALKALEAKLEDDAGNGSQLPENKRVEMNSPRLAWLPALLEPPSDGSLQRSLGLRLTAPADPDAEALNAIRPPLLELFDQWGIELGEKEQLLSLDRSKFSQLLAAAAGGELPIRQREEGEGRSSHRFSVAETRTRLPLRARYDGGAEEVCLRRDALPDTGLLRGGAEVWAIKFAERQAIRVGVGGDPSEVLRQLESLFEKPAEQVAATVSLEWLLGHLDEMHCMFHMECSDELIDVLRVVPAVPEVTLSVEGSLNRIDLKFGFHYRAGEVANPAFEAAAIRRIPSSGSRPSRGADLSRAEQGQPYRRSAQLFIRGENDVLGFYAGELDRLIAEGRWQIQIGERFAGLTREIEKVRPQIGALRQETDWLSFDLSFVAGDGEALDEGEVRRLMATGRSVGKLDGRRKVAIDQAAVTQVFEALELADAEQAVASSTERRINNSQFFYLEGVKNDLASDSSGGEGQESDPSTPGLTAALRSYQQDGVRWMWRRLRRRHGIILADEMGLGKTVQSLAVVAAMAGNLADDEETASLGPTLIVCPTSLIRTWEREAATFLPAATVLVLHGSGRERDFDRIAGVDLVITSYGSLVRDVERYQEICFRLVVADEASAIKNPRTKTARAVLKLSATARLALTGTPVENSIQDLWSIMQFANPGYLGRRDDFLARFSGDDPGTTRSLRQRIAPCLLRRTKAEVATDLPGRLERVLYCDLTRKQRAVYEKLLREGRNNLKSIVETGLPQSPLEVLTVLLRLRQTCCDLRLLGGEGASPRDSAKLDAFDTLITESLAGGHRVLVFSQFVGMLSLLRGHLDEAGHRYAYLDGATPAKRRAEQVEAFQGSRDLPIFLISLKAGGYGLTLTGADTVIHFDPWWNPAVEAQATDRAHRIGQSRPVTAYKLIATGTVEEKILQLQERKRGVIDAALDDRRPLMSSLTREDLDFVLS